MADLSGSSGSSGSPLLLVPYKMADISWLLAPARLNFWPMVSTAQRSTRWDDDDGVDDDGNIFLKIALDSPLNGAGQGVRVRSLPVQSGLPVVAACQHYFSINFSFFIKLTQKFVRSDLRTLSVCVCVCVLGTCWSFGRSCADEDEDMDANELGLVNPPCVAIWFAMHFDLLTPPSTPYQLFILHLFLPPFISVGSSVRRAVCPSVRPCVRLV